MDVQPSIRPSHRGELKSIREFASKSLRSQLSPPCFRGQEPKTLTLSLLTLIPSMGKFWLIWTTELLQQLLKKPLKAEVETIACLIRRQAPNLLFQLTLTAPRVRRSSTLMRSSLKRDTSPNQRSSRHTDRQLEPNYRSLPQRSQESIKSLKHRSLPLP